MTHLPLTPPANYVISEPASLQPSPKGRAGIAWLIIVLLTVAVIWLHMAESGPSTGGGGGTNGTEDDSLDLVLTEMQAKWLVGASAIFGGSGFTAGQVEQLFSRGTIGQRQRVIVLAGELAGSKTAGNLLRKLDQLIDEEQEKGSVPPFQLTERQAAIQRLLHVLYDAAEERSVSSDPGDTSAPSPPSDILPESERQVLLDELGWFGQLALAPSGDDDATAREAVLSPARRVAALFLGVFVAGGLAGLAGIGGLVALLVLAATRKLPARFGLGLAHHGIYAETFAIWMGLLLAFQLAAGLAGWFAPGLLFVFIILAFVGSLAALAWPVFRGIPWSEVRHDIGLSLGRNPALEPLIGVCGYILALPILAVGIGFVLLLMWIQDVFSQPGPTFAPSGAPAHPVILELLGDNPWPKIQVLILAAVIAPIVEETMFRGVLYRHLRDASASLGVVLSILFSAVMSGFIFAAIHPQGWVAIPALMSLAFAFVLLREWRGTVIPCMIAHGISNFIVISLLILALGA